MMSYSNVGVFGTKYVDIAVGGKSLLPVMRRYLISCLLLLIMLLPGALACGTSPQGRARRVGQQQKRLAPSSAQSRSACPAPATKYTSEQTEPLRFVRVEGCTSVWRNVYNDPRIPDLRLKYTGTSPIPAGTAPGAVFMVTRTIKDGYLVSARLENGSYRTWKPPFPFKPTPVLKPTPTPAPRSTATPRTTPVKEGWSLPKAEPMW